MSIAGADGWKIRHDRRRGAGAAGARSRTVDVEPAAAEFRHWRLCVCSETRCRNALLARCRNSGYGVLEFPDTARC